MFFVTHRKVFYTIIAALLVACVGVLMYPGLRFGIEFVGGSMVEVRYEGERPEKNTLESQLAALGLGSVSLRASGDNNYLLRTQSLEEGAMPSVLEALSTEGNTATLDRSATIGPVIGGEMQKKAFVAIFLVMVAIILYVAFAFREKTPENEAQDVRKKNEQEKEAPPVSSWTYGLIAIMVLLHDMLVPLGVVAVLGLVAGLEVDVLIVMALLTILGYSVNDTIVIFDRVRERMLKNKESHREETFAETVGTALSQTYTRSINTSFTTLVVVVSLLVFGGSTTTYFALVLAVGVFAGTYSSLALAAPLLVSVHEYVEKKREVA